MIRANQGDCVEIAYTNNATGGSFGIHVDGLAFDIASSGDQVGMNASYGTGPRAASTTYHYYIPKTRTSRARTTCAPARATALAVAHGLFGALVVEPKGSTYLKPRDGTPLASGWEAMIQPAQPGARRSASTRCCSTRSATSSTGVAPYDKNGVPLPTIDKHTGAYRPGSRAINYRSEPFMHRLDKNADESQSYGTYTFGDPATPIARAYLGDPTKFRIVHAGSEMFHVFHMHGGGIRWRFNPVADQTFDYAETGLDKSPKAQLSPSTRLDSQATGPGEAYNLEIEGGAGGVQQAAGEFLFHCHIASHYVSGMWAFWRVYDTNQPGFAALPDRTAPADAVDSSGLIGRTMPDGTTITAANLDAWIRPQLPAAGRHARTTRTPRSGTGQVDRTEPGRARLPRRARGHERLGGQQQPARVPGASHGVSGRRVPEAGGREGRQTRHPVRPAQRAHLVPADAYPRRQAAAVLTERPLRAHRGSERRAMPRPPAPARRRSPAAATASARPGSTVRRFNVVSLDGLRLQLTKAGAVDPERQGLRPGAGRRRRARRPQADRAARDPRQHR